MIFIDAVNVKIREGQVASRPVYLALGVTVDGERDVLGLWAGEHGDGEGAKYWLRVLAEIKNRGVRDVCMLVCDGLKGLPDAVGNVWEDDRANMHRPSPAEFIQVRVEKGLGADRERPQARVHRRVRIRGAGPVRRILRQVGEALPGYHPALGERVGGIRAVPAVRPEIRTVICTTNAIESINARLRRVVNARGHFPTEQAAMKCLYLAIMSLDPTGKGRKRWTNRWKAALNAFDMTFDGRLSAGRK